MKFLKILSQTLKPDDNPEEGQLVAACLYDGDRCEKVWVLEGQGDPRANEVEIDTLGVERVYRKNLTRYDLTPPNESALEK